MKFNFTNSPNWNFHRSGWNYVINHLREVFHNEKDDMVLAGLMTGIYAHLDDTSGRVNGQNQYVHILCSEYFVAYFTREHKTRMTILEILGQGIVSHCFDEKTFELLQIMGCF